MLMLLVLLVLEPLSVLPITLLGKE